MITATSISSLAVVFSGDFPTFSSMASFVRAATCTQGDQAVNTERNNTPQECLSFAVAKDAYSVSSA